MQNLITSTFETVNCVEEGVQLLDVFQHLSGREVFLTHTQPSIHTHFITSFKTLHTVRLLLFLANTVNTNGSGRTDHTQTSDVTSFSLSFTQEVSSRTSRTHISPLLSHLCHQSLQLLSLRCVYLVNHLHLSWLLPSSSVLFSFFSPSSFHSVIHLFNLKIRSAALARLFYMHYS